MKKSRIMNFVILMTAFYIIGLASAACDLSISILNQDPYPAIQGDYVKVVFQIDGLQGTECGTVTFGVKEGYPFYLDPGVENPKTINSGTFEKDYSSSSQVPYQLRVDENALDGKNPIEVYYSTSKATGITKDFNITVQDTRADFDINVKNYDYATRTLTFEIRNIAKVDSKLLRIEVPKQTGIQIKGSNINTVGDLDSHEYTTADFEAILPEGETAINLNIVYIDTIGTQRELQKVVDFDSSYFTGRDLAKKQPYWVYGIIILIVVVIVWRRISKKKREEERRKKRGMM